MTTSQIIACTIAWTAAAVAILALIRVRRTAHPGERCGIEKPTFFPSSQPTECLLRPGHSGSHLDEHGTRWRLLPVTAKDGVVCEAYRLPTTTEDSGLCAHCGMSDYKHREPRHA